MTKLSYSEKLKRWRAKHEEEYARVIMEPPLQTTLMRAIPHPGLVLIMGAKGKGKSALAHGIAHEFNKRKGLPAVMHLPTMPEDLRKDVKKLLPPWYTITLETKKWLNSSIVIWDETSQGAHARRTQSKESLNLDNLMGISRQRNQTIVFIAHHSRKIDPNIIRDVDRIIWKSPTYAHYMFERSELSDFVLKAIDFFDAMPSEMKQKRTSLMMDFHKMVFSEFANKVPPYWSENLSHLFEEIRI